MQSASILYLLVLFAVLICSICAESTARLGRNYPSYGVRRLYNGQSESKPQYQHSEYHKYPKNWISKSRSGSFGRHSKRCPPIYIYDSMNDLCRHKRGFFIK